MDAARTPGWEIVRRSESSLLATRESEIPGLPWSVVAEKVGRGLRVSVYEPGDDTSAEGAEIGLLTGNPRDTGRQLRDVLSDL